MALVMPAVLLVGPLGCDSEEQAHPSTTAPDGVDVESESQGDVGAIDSEDTPHATRAVRRLPIDVLQASLPIVAGNDATGAPVQWRVGDQDALSDDVFGKVLGRPDYVAATEESRAPSSLYVKFVGDMARDVCHQRAQNDLKMDEPTLWRFAPVDGSATDVQITDNLRYLVLRFLGMRLDAEDPYIAKLRKVFDAGRATVQDEWAGGLPDVEGWRGVCIGLFESPAFHAY
jgi:hypothetical protein